MKAILINVHDRTVSEVEYGGKIDEIYKLIGADCFDVARINEKGDGIFVDDNGLLGDPDEQIFFRIEAADFGYPQRLAGNGLLLGCDEDGNSISPTLQVDQVRDAVWWVKANGKPVLDDGNVLFVASPLDSVTKRPDGTVVSHGTLLSMTGSDTPAWRVTAKNVDEAKTLYDVFLQRLTRTGKPYTVTPIWSKTAGRKFAGYDRATERGGPLETAYVNESAAKQELYD